MRAIKIIIGVFSLLLAVYFGLCAVAAGSVTLPYDMVVFVLVALSMGASGFFLIAKQRSKLSKTVVCLNLFAWIFLSGIGVPAFVRARNTSASNACTNNLRQIDGAKQQWALEHNATSDSRPTWNDILPYLGRGSNGEMPHCSQGGTYILESVGQTPRCSIGGPGHELL